MDKNTFLESKSDVIDKHVSNDYKRQSNFELLRIFAMLFIIGHHFSVHSGFVFSDSSISIERVWLQFISMGGKLGIDLFIMISGYFLIKVQSIKISKEVKLWLIMFTYSVGIYLVFFFTHKVPSFDGQYFLCCLFPVASNQWGFATNYFILFLLVPLINKALNNIDRKTYRNYLILFFILWSVLPTLTGFFVIFNATYGLSDLLWFIYLYAFAGYIRLYFDVKKHKPYFYFSIALCSSIFILIFFILMNKSATYPLNFSDQADYFYKPQYITCFIVAVFIFLFFASLNMRYSKIINIIASSVFGVYLIHDNFLMRTKLWMGIIHGTDYQYSLKIIPYSIGVVIIIFCVCSIIELIRIYLIEKPYMKFFARLDKNK